MVSNNRLEDDVQRSQANHVGPSKATTDLLTRLQDTMQALLICLPLAFAALSAHASQVNFSPPAHLREIELDEFASNEEHGRFKLKRFEVDSRLAVSVLTWTYGSGLPSSQYHVYLCGEGRCDRIGCFSASGEGT